LPDHAFVKAIVSGFVSADQEYTDAAGIEGEENADRVAPGLHPQFFHVLVP
jgi:hypothetical protein